MQKFLDEITADQLEEISEMAGVFFTPKQIAQVMELPVNEFVAECDTEGTPIYNAYQAGFLKNEYEVRLAVVKLAKSGSSPAQTMTLDMINKSRIKRTEV